MIKAQLPKAMPDGRTVLVLTPLELIALLAALVPPPRVHRHRYYGVLAPNARLRAAVTALAANTEPAPEPAEPDAAEALTRSPVPLGHTARPHLCGVSSHLPGVWRSDANHRLHHRPVSTQSRNVPFSPK